MDDHDRDDPDDEPPPHRPTATELRRHRRTVPGGVAVLDLARAPEPDPDLVPWPVVADHGDAEALRQAGRDPTEPAMPAEITAIVKRLRRELREEFRAMGVDPDLANRLNRLERDFEPVRRLGKWAAGVALGAALAIGAFLYRRGADEQRIADEIKAASDKAARCETKIDSLLNIKDSRP